MVEHYFRKVAVVGPIPTLTSIRYVAQLVGASVCEAEEMGSIPIYLTISRY